jgi:predicted homoserine dehydrogenase-like protein
MVIREELLRRAAVGTPIRVGVVGAGPFGLWVSSQVAHTAGMKLCVVADRIPEKALAIFEAAGYSREDVVVGESAHAVFDAAIRGRPAVVPEGDIVAECPVDVVVDATGYPETGASLGHRTLLAGKHLVSVNVEADCLIGAILRRTADAVGTTYNLAAGDQPGNATDLFNYASAIGLQVVAIGLGHGQGTAEDDAERMRRAIELQSRNKIAAADGSKTQIEMCSLANAIGLPPDVRGMHHFIGPASEIPRVFCPQGAGGILARAGVVDYARCNPPDRPYALEVFAVVTSDNPVVLDVFRDKGSFTSQDGRCALLARSIHLCGIETPWTIAQAVITGKSAVSPAPTPVAEVIAIAKRQLRAGEELDSVGGLTVRGVIERVQVARRDNLVPLGLCQNVRVVRDVPEGAALTYTDITGPMDSFAWTLRRLQDAQLRATSETSGLREDLGLLRDRGVH